MNPQIKKFQQELNQRFAEILGWTNLFIMSGAIIGTPPVGEEGVRGQAMVPDWTGDWRYCGPLQITYRISPTLLIPENIHQGMMFIAGGYLTFSNKEEADALIRCMYVVAVIEKLSRDSLTNTKEASCVN